MDMTITIVLLAVAILGLLCYVIGLRECMADLRRYNDYLERSLSNTSHYLVDKSIEKELAQAKMIGITL